MSRGLAGPAEPAIGEPPAGNDRIAGFGSADGTVRAALCDTPNWTGPERNGGGATFPGWATAGRVACATAGLTSGSFAAAIGAAALAGAAA